MYFSFDLVKAFFVHIVLEPFRFYVPYDIDLLSSAREQSLAWYNLKIVLLLPYLNRLSNKRDYGYLSLFLSAFAQYGK